MNRSLLDTTTGFGLLLKKFYYMKESFKATCNCICDPEYYTKRLFSFLQNLKKYTKNA